MGDENPIRSLGDYSKPSHEGYRNTIELPDGNNVSTDGKLRDRNAKESWALFEDPALYDNESWNDPMDFTKSVKAISLPQDVPSTSNRRLIELENQIYSGPHDTQYCMENPEQAFADYASSRTAYRRSGRKLHGSRGAPQSKGIKSPSKLLFPKYLSQSSLEEQNKNPSSLKYVNFINSIVILRKEDESREEGSIGSDAAKDISCDTTIEVEKKAEGLDCSKTVFGEDKQRDIKQNKPDDRTGEETKEVGEVEMENEKSEEEIEEEEANDPEYFDTFPTIQELGYHEWILKNPRPPWVSPKVKAGNLNNIKISCMVGQFLKEQAYIVLDSPINVMSRLNYYWIMSEDLKSRRKPSNPKKISNFVGRVKGLKVFVCNFTYECDFVMLEDTTSVIDHYLGGIVLGKPFVK
nr:MAK10-like protein [Tanacetum cinerariifolium]